VSPVEVDHLVVAAATLEQGDAWCRETLGVPSVEGGRHAGMGTHNRLLAIESAAFPRTYLEIISIDPQAPPPARPRWFGLDTPALQQGLHERPRLMHVVARCSGLDERLAALRMVGVDAGLPVAAERASARGLLRWRIAGRADGQLLFGGALPTLNEWQGAHPAEHLPPSPVRLAGLALGGLPPAVVDALGLQAVRAAAEAPALSARFETPLGTVTLSSADGCQASQP